MTLMTASRRTPAFALAGLALAAALAGCSSTKLDTGPAPIESRGAGASTSTTTTEKAQSQVQGVDLTAGNGNAAAGTLERVVYFDFDSFAIKDEYRGLIEGNAKALKANPQKKLVIEGHTDERGGREYNLALGQKRAEAVMKSLELLGAADAQLEATSFGKERPAVQGSTEEAWAKNRRAELRDR